MINHSILNEALTRVPDKDFKVLYYILNNISFNNGKGEIHNGRLMETFNLGERQIQKITKRLVDCGYINKEVLGTSRNHKANIYSEGEVQGVSSNANPEFTPKKDQEKNINNNYTLSTRTQDQETKIEKNKLNNINSSEMDLGPENASDESIIYNSDDMKVEYTDEELQACYANAINEFQMMEETRVNWEPRQSQTNEWFGRTLTRGYDLLHSLQKSYTQDGTIAYIRAIDAEIISAWQKAIDAGALTQGQKNTIKNFNDQFDKTIENKQNYFSGKYKQNKAHQTQEKTPDEELYLSEEKNAPEPQEQANNEYLSMEELSGDKQTSINNEKEIEKTPAPITDAEIDSLVAELETLLNEGRYLEYKSRKSEIDKIVYERASDSQYFYYKNLLAFA